MTVHQRSQARCRVFVTGAGAVTPLGHSIPETWEAALRGESGFRPGCSQLDVEALDVGGTCEVRDWEPSRFFDPKTVKRRDRAQLFAAAAIAEAILAAGIDFDDPLRLRTGIYFGVGYGGAQSMMEADAALREKGARRISSHSITRIMPNGPAAWAAVDYGIQGPVVTLTTACASSSDAIIAGWKDLQLGLVDIAIVGGAESPFTNVSVASFARVGAMSSQTSETPRPFDRERDGFVMAEGAAVLILEDSEHAYRRGVTGIAELTGVGQSCDGQSIVAPSSTGAATAMNRALNSASQQPCEIDYINAHGTGTPLNDKAETAAIKSVYGEHAAKLAISSTKSMTGHALGAAGAIEAALCVQVIKDGLVPPTINLTNSDPQCDLDYVPTQSRELAARNVANHSFGFGGQNSVILFGSL